MITNNEEKNLNLQIEENIKELEIYKNSYDERIKLYNIYLNTMDIFKNGNVEKEGLDKQNLQNKLYVFENQAKKIDENLNMLNNFKNNNSIDEEAINKYNQNFQEIKNNYINNCVQEEQVTTNYIDGLLTDFIETLENTKKEKNEDAAGVLDNDSEEKTEEMQGVKNNDTLLISEEKNQIILPYKAKEVIEILNNEPDKYENAEDVIIQIFTRPFSDYRFQIKSRFHETMKLAREREKYGLLDSIVLSTEMMAKRMLHPAIISACRTLNELDVYLDCLDKNETDQFKIFKIKYELYPMVTKQKKGRKGNRYKECIEQ